jgi:hypothetical protein
MHYFIILIFLLSHSICQKIDEKLPPEVKIMLNSRLPGWKWGVVTKEIKTFYKNEYGVDYPNYFIGEFNGDGKKIMH